MFQYHRGHEGIEEVQGFQEAGKSQKIAQWDYRQGSSPQWDVRENQLSGEKRDPKCLQQRYPDWCNRPESEMHDKCLGVCVKDSRSQRDTNSIDKERNGQSVWKGEVAGRQTLEFGVKLDGWLEPAETNDPYIPQDSQTSSLILWKGTRLMPLQGLGTG